MTTEACTKALKAGAELVLQQYNDGCNCTGLVKWASQHLISRIADALLDRSAIGAMRWPWHGLNDDQLQNKLAVLQQALNQHKDITEPLDILATFGVLKLP